MAGLRENVHPAVRFHHDDIRSRGVSPLFERVDAIIHLAAKNCLADNLADRGGGRVYNIGLGVNYSLPSTRSSSRSRQSSRRASSRNGG